MSDSEVIKKVRNHFNDDALRFDSIYQSQKSLFARFVDNYWRGVVKKRLEINLEKLAPLKGKTVLDVGCGSGRFCFEYAKAGAGRVVGIDFAPSMIEIANKLAKQLGVDKQCDFRVGTFPDAIGDEMFDVSTANGFFDYTDNPAQLISAMHSITRETIIMSFPKAYEWRVPVRRIRFWLKGTPLFLYSLRQIKKMLVDVGFEQFELINLGRDYLIIVHLRNQAGSISAS